jgi:glutamine---fructose-6-phosphate transaminase (isomerizing)
MTSRMASEIREQPDAIARTLDGLLPLRSRIGELAQGCDDVLLVARGSSDNAGVYGRYLLEIHSQHAASLAAPSLATHYHVERDLQRTLVVSLSQSGTTEEIVQTQAWAAARGARTVAITNDGHSQLAAEADLALVTAAGPELAVPATKSYTTQLAAIAVLADALGPSDRSLESDLRRTPEQLERLLATDDSIAAAVDLLATPAPTIVSGRGLAYGTALETALKLEETCLQPVRGLSYADLRHGPIAVVDEDLVAILVSAADGPMVSGMTTLAQDLVTRGARTFGIGGDTTFAETCDLRLPGPDLPELIAPLGLILPAQLTIEALARRRGLDPDEPRGLSKVTQTDLGPTTPTNEEPNDG